MEFSFEYELFTHHDVTMNGILPIDFGSIWSRAQPISLGGQSAWIMAPPDLLIAACINSCRKRYFRLKSLLDIAEIIGSHPEMAWSQVVALSHRYRCRYIVYTALFITRQLLDCPIPDTVLRDLDVSLLRARIIRNLIQRLSLRAFTLRHSGIAVLGRRVDWPLILPYATLSWTQVIRRLHFVLFYTEDGAQRRWRRS